jgi:hypothetical protein
MLNGPLVEYIGRGDLHETKFDHLAIHSEMAGLGGFRIRESKYTGPDIDSNFCPYTFHLYPSTILEDKYSTSRPIFLALGAVGIFVFTSLIFVLYDAAVERRQRIVLTSAEKTSAVVSSLFPEAVRDRLMEESREREQEGGPSPDRDWDNSMGVEKYNPHQARFKGGVIADLYPHTTVVSTRIVFLLRAKCLFLVLARYHLTNTVSA